MEAAGIDMLPLEAGVPLIRRELTVGATRGEIVIGQRLGSMMAEFDETGGVETSTMTADRLSGPMIGKVTGVGLQRGASIETALNPAVQPFLHDHQIDGTPVLPGVMGIEAFAEAARSMLPDWHVAGMEDVNFLAPVKFYRSEPRTLTIASVFHDRRDGVVANCELIGTRTLPNQREPQRTTHFTGKVRLMPHTPEPGGGNLFKTPSGTAVEADVIYRLYFHGPAYQVLERAWWDGERVVGQFANALPVNHQPADYPLYASPRLIELCFQTAGIWEMGVQGRMGLPQHIDHISFFGVPNPAQGPLYSVVTPHPASGTFDAEIVDAKGKQYIRVTGYRTVALADSVNAESLKALQATMSLQAAVA
jgi:hypothetical protein